MDNNNLELWILRLGAIALLILDIAYIIKYQLRRLFSNQEYWLHKPNLEIKGDNLEQLDD